MKQHRRGLLIAQLGLVLALALGVWWSFRSNVLSPAGSPLPEKIARLSLVSSTSGEAALAQMSGLHGLDLSLDDGYVGEYQGGGERLTAWVGVAASPAKADELVRRMTEKIQDGNEMFSHAGTTNLHGTAVHVILGGGGTSYYFPRGKEVIWLTVVSSQPEALLEAALEAWH